MLTFKHTTESKKAYDSQRKTYLPQVEIDGVQRIKEGEEWIISGWWGGNRFIGNYSTKDRTGFIKSSI